jgi:DME family drug/metabolite transporter
VRESTVGTAAILLYSAPAFVVVLAWLFLGESLNAAKVFALVLTVGGIFLVVGAYDPANLEVSPKVLLTGLLSGLTYGLYAIFGRPLAGHLSPAVILSYALAFGSALLVVAALPTFHTLAGLPAGSYTLWVMLGVVHTTLAFAMYTFGIRHLGAGRAAIVATIEPVVAGILGMTLLNEELTALKVPGALLVLAGAILVQVRPGKAHPRSGPA